jgi:hypothetical protein
VLVIRGWLSGVTVLAGTATGADVTPPASAGTLAAWDFHLALAYFKIGVIAAAAAYLDLGFESLAGRA